MLNRGIPCTIPHFYDINWVIKICFVHLLNRAGNFKMYLNDHHWQDPQQKLKSFIAQSYWSRVFPCYKIIGCTSGP